MGVKRTATLKQKQKALKAQNTKLNKMEMVQKMLQKLTKSVFFLNKKCFGGDNNMTDQLWNTC